MEKTEGENCLRLDIARRLVGLGQSDRVSSRNGQWEAMLGFIPRFFPSCDTFAAIFEGWEKTEG